MDETFIDKVILGNHTAEGFHAMAELWHQVVQQFLQTVKKLVGVVILYLAVLPFQLVVMIHLLEVK